MADRNDKIPSHQAFNSRDVDAKNVSASTAGASSGDFHVYRHQRRTEMDRLDRMKKEAREKDRKEKDFNEAMERKKKEDLQTMKRAAKRKRKKQRRDERKKQKHDVTPQPQEGTKADEEERQG